MNLYENFAKEFGTKAFGPSNNNYATGLDALRVMGRLTKRVRPDGCIIHQVEKDFPCLIIKEEGDSDLERDFIASDGRIDRMGDTIKVNGWDIGHFKQHGSILLDHVYRVENIIGKPSKIWKEGAGDERSLRIRIKFDSPEENSASAIALPKIASGSLANGSVGFNPIEWEWRREKKDDDSPERIVGINFLKQELLEFSLVAVPANPGAHILAAAQEEVAQAEHTSELAMGEARKVLRATIAKAGFGMRMMQVNSKLKN